MTELASASDGSDTRPDDTSVVPHDVFEALPLLVVIDGQVGELSPGVEPELEVDAQPLLGPLDAIGTRLDDVTFEELCRGNAPLRVRLRHELSDRPVRLRRLGGDGERTWLEIRSLRNEFRLESLLRRNTAGHMLLSPAVQLEWSISSNDLAAVLPGDDPMEWVDLMDADDMQTLGRAIAAVGADPNLRLTVSHRLNADRTYTIVDTVESAMHDPDLRAVLVRSRLEDSAATADLDAASPYARTTVSDHMPIGVIVASMAGKILHRNVVAAELVGARAGQLAVPDGTEPWLMSRLDPEQSARYQSVFGAAVAGQPAHCTISSPFDPGRWLRMSISPAAASTVVMTIEDMTELVETERALRASNRLLEALDSHSEDLVIVFDALGRSRYTSSSAHRHLAENTTIGTTDELIDVVLAADRQPVADLIRRVRAAPSSSEAIEFRIDRPGDAGGRWHHATMTNLLDDPDVQGLVLTVRDVHERHLVERELVFRATHDALTTLPDRAALQTRLESVLRESERTGRRTALMFCDIDNFKLINDRAGHRVGDLVLTAVADRLRSALRSSDVVGRFGGDEFVIVTPDVADEAHALDLANRVFGLVTGPARCDGIDVEVSVSIGVAVSDATGTTAAGLLHRADVAMYESKRSGRGRVTSYTPEHDRGRRDDDLATDLRSAIEGGELSLHYQPLVPLADGLARGFEGLARWEHPEHGLLDAGRFLALAENTGLATELGDALLRLAADDQRSWLAGGDDFVCVNLSASQLGHPDVADSFLDRMRRRGAEPHQLVIELTEGAFGQGPTVQTNLVTFRDAGVRIFLDDFGIGYSSLSNLHQFPVDGIKIDASVINPTVDESLVRLIVGVATTLDIRTVAEGIETSEQLDAVTRLGVDYAQGYLLGRPSRTPTSRAVT